MSEPGTSGGFISGGGRPPFFRYVMRLYSGDQVFQGVVDFAVMGGIVLLFLHPPSTAWLRGWMTHQPAPATQPSAAAPPTQPAAPAGKSAANPPANPSPSAAGGSAAPPPANSTISASVPMPFLEDVRRPRLNVRFLFEIDEKAFFSSEPEDRPRLRNAAQAYREYRYADILDSLAGARSSDPNVAFMRGLGALYAAIGPVTVDQLRAAAAGGQKQAATILGAALVTGPRGVDKDVETGRRLIEEAAAKGDHAAQRAAGIGYVTGAFGVLDPFKAATYFKNAVAGGDIAAMPFYAHMMFTGAGVEKDEGGAEELVERAARAGLTIAQETLGTWYLERYKTGVISDPSDGVRWLEKAYQDGLSIGALVRLAVFYSDEGRGPKWRDRNKAFELFGTAAAFTDSRAQFGYASGFQFGHPDKDLEKAYTHYELARQLGSTGAAGRLKTLDDLLTPAERASALEAARLLRRDLKPIPRIVVLQYPNLPKPASPWVAPTPPAANPPPPAPVPQP